MTIPEHFMGKLIKSKDQIIIILQLFLLTLIIGPFIGGLVLLLVNIGSILSIIIMGIFMLAGAALTLGLSIFLLGTLSLKLHHHGALRGFSMSFRLLSISMLCCMVIMKGYDTCARFYRKTADTINAWLAKKTIKFRLI